MSLRMNLYGWSFADFKKVLGSGDTALLETASATLGECFTDEKPLRRARAWLRTLIEKGHPFNTVREDEPQDEAGLLKVSMEAESHVFVVEAIRRAIAKPEFLDLAMDSSNWNRGAISMLQRETSECDFSSSDDYGLPMMQAEYILGAGSPLFGDRFHTTWSFYSLLDNEMLGLVVPSLEAATTYERKLPDNFPEHLRAEMPTRLSDSAREFAGALAGWFKQLHGAGQDAFVLWW